MSTDHTQQLAAYDAAPYAPESRVEIVAVAMFDAARGWTSLDGWVTAHDQVKGHYRRLAQAAIDALLPQAPAGAYPATEWRLMGTVGTEPRK